MPGHSSCLASGPPTAPTRWTVGELKVLRPSSQRNPLSRPTSGLGCFPLSPGRAGWRDFPGRVRGWEGLGDMGWAWARQEEASLIPQAWLPPTPQGPWSPAGTALHLLPALPARPGGQYFPSQPRVSSPGWTCLWSGRGPWQSQPCGLGSPWLLDAFAPCPWVLWSFQGLPLA